MLLYSDNVCEVGFPLAVTEVDCSSGFTLESAGRVFDRAVRILCVEGSEKLFVGAAVGD